MTVDQVLTEKLGHYAYVICSGSVAAVVDPRRDVGVYLEKARARGARITHVLLTHLHADFLCGALELSGATGAEILAPAKAQARFVHRAVAAGDCLILDQVLLEVRETPGHSPESLCYLAKDLSRSAREAILFSGDTVLVGGFGRPDVFPEQKEELGRALWRSLKAFSDLPPEVQILPAHGQGSLCGVQTGAMAMTTLGYEQMAQPLWRAGSEEAFLSGLLAGMGPVPPYFGELVQENRERDTLADRQGGLACLQPAEVREWMASGVQVLDCRSAVCAPALFVPGALLVSLRGPFPLLARWVLRPDQPVLLVAGSEAEAREARLHLYRMGVDRVLGGMEGMEGWVAQGEAVDSCSFVSPRNLGPGGRWPGGVVLDVREEEPGRPSFGLCPAEPFPWYHFLDAKRALPGDGDLLLLCRGGVLSALAASLARLRAPQRPVHILAGGLEALAGVAAPV